MHMQLEFLQDAGHPVNSNLPSNVEIDDQFGKSQLSLAPSK
jgi:hypothetical protein